MGVVSKSDLEKESCQRCGKPFKKKVFWQKYCSKACKVIAWGLKEANKVIKCSILFMLFSSHLYALEGKASWYDSKSACPYNPDPKCPMANGESIYGYERSGRYFAASWDYAFGSQVAVTNVANNERVIVIITDRGPAKRLYRVIDLSRLAFEKIADPKQGIINVTVETL